MVASWDRLVGEGLWGMCGGSRSVRFVNSTPILKVHYHLQRRLEGPPAEAGHCWPAHLQQLHLWEACLMQVQSRGGYARHLPGPAARRGLASCPLRHRPWLQLRQPQCWCSQQAGDCSKAPLAPPHDRLSNPRPRPPAYPRPGRAAGPQTLMWRSRSSYRCRWQAAGAAVERWYECGGSATVEGSRSLVTTAAG